MGRTVTTKMLVPLTALALVLGACAGDEGGGATDTAATEGMSELAEESDQADDMDDDHEDFAFGEAADAADADRTVEIEATTPFVFEPAEVTVAVGETVTFEVTNTDSIDHDFTLGDEEAQEEHEAEMREMDEMDGEMEHSDPNTMIVPAGETMSITWTFTEPGVVLYGCHEPGHYAAGMVGEITVEG